jgi:zinc/manganese transport system permease protein
MNWAALDVSILGPALLAGAIVLSTHVPLGRQVLKRGIIFIDLAVAQTAGLGVIAANTFGWEIHGPAAQLAAFAAALGGALILTWTDARYSKVQEALIGMLFVLAATGGILLLANNPRGGEELRDLLIGQILWVDWHTLWPAAIVSAVVLGVLMSGYQQRFGRIGFYMLFALSVTVSVQLVGIFLVFSSLIVPALATRSITRRPLAVGYTVGFLGYLIGLVCSAQFDLPTGAVIVWALACTALVAARILPSPWRERQPDSLAGNVSEPS